MKGFLILIHIVLFIFNGLLMVFDGKSQNIEKELSLRFTVVIYITGLFQLRFWLMFGICVTSIWEEPNLT